MSYAETQLEPNTPDFFESHPEAIRGIGTLAVLKQQRAEFVDQLVDNHLISSELASSGELDRFSYDVPTETDSLLHILVGDNYGGAHHLNTIIGNDMPNRVVASMIQDPSSPKALSRLRKEQKVRPNGVFASKIVKINGNSKDNGSTMFPLEWSTEKVIRSILRVSDQAPDQHDYERSSFAHQGEVDGVKIKVVTDEKTGKIIMAWPKA